MGEYNFVSSKMRSKYLVIHVQDVQNLTTFYKYNWIYNCNLNILLYADCWNQKYFPEM